MWVKVDTEEGLKSLKVGDKVKVNRTETTIESFAISGFITDNLFTDINNRSEKYFSYLSDFLEIPLYKWVEDQTPCIALESTEPMFTKRQTLESQFVVALLSTDYHDITQDELVDIAKVYADKLINSWENN